ncbi:MAG: Ppx/GppA family phosphatase [Clostridia bacterium]|nr:Ppx/GppA family phosphatase [Clostridia bacterium]
MKFGVIDVGSNSVRLMISEGTTTLNKFVQTTRLAEGMNEDEILKTVAIERTVAAVSFFCDKAKSLGVDKLFCFATAAVRKAKNGKVFVEKVKETCGVDVDVISGETEAKIGYMGALDGKDGAIVDVGGASTEIIVVKGGVQVYSKSLNIGAVVTTDICGQDYSASKTFIEDKIEEYGIVPNSAFYAIGGTATTMVSIALGLEPYDPKKVHGYKLEKSQLSRLCDMLFSMSVEERKQIRGLQKDRAKVIANGANILLLAMEKVGADYFIVSESDNLEGYLKLKTEKI